jgi:GxxExxY protein
MGTDADVTRLDALRHRATTEEIIGLFFAVYNELGSGFLESVYRNALAVALDQRGIRNLREAPLEVFFRGARVGLFRADLLVNDCVVVEIKVAHALDRSHEAQLLNYLRASPIETGILLNFGRKATFRRLIYTNDRKAFVG